jgi:hypothetical protein
MDRIGVWLKEHYADGWLEGLNIGGYRYLFLP